MAQFKLGKKRSGQLKLAINALFLCPLSHESLLVQLLYEEVLQLTGLGRSPECTQEGEGNLQETHNSSSNHGPDEPAP